MDRTVFSKQLNNIDYFTFILAKLCTEGKLIIIVYH